MKISADEDGKYMEMEVEAEFEKPLNPQQLVDVTQLILNTINPTSTKGLLLEGLSYFKVEIERIHIRFRYTTTLESIKLLDAERRDVLPRLQSQFVIYVFAVIDRSFRLGKVPFPPDFRSFINFPQ